jgi:hypothetical protein
MDPHAGLPRYRVTAGLIPLSRVTSDECSVNYMFEVRVEVAGGEKGGGVSCGYFHPFVVAEVKTLACATPQGPKKKLFYAC